MLHPSSSRSRKADLHRILDPAYCKQSPSSPPTSTWAYIDHAGEYHDPDFRDFPILNNNRRQSRASPRPSWELHLDENVIDDDDDDALEDEDDGPLFLSNAPHPQRHHRYSSSSYASQQRRTRETMMYPRTYYSPATTSATLPTSYESDITVFTDSSSSGSPFDKKERSLLLRGVKKIRRYSNGQRASLDLPSTTEEENEKQDRERNHAAEVEQAEFGGENNVDVDYQDDERVLDIEKRTEYVQTCTESLRRQWQSFSLSIQFGVFRARRRVMRRVHSLL